MPSYLLIKQGGKPTWWTFGDNMENSKSLKLNLVTLSNINNEQLLFSQSATSSPDSRRAPTPAGPTGTRCSSPSTSRRRERSPSSSAAHLNSARYSRRSVTSTSLTTGKRTSDQSTTWSLYSRPTQMRPAQPGQCLQVHPWANKGQGGSLLLQLDVAWQGTQEEARRVQVWLQEGELLISFDSCDQLLMQELNLWPGHDQ